MRIFLMLGASSEIAMEYIRRVEWSKDDILLLQYNQNGDSLKELQSKIECKVELFQCNYLSEESMACFCKSIAEKDFAPTHILHTSAIPVVNRYFREENWEDVQMQMSVQCGSLFMVLKQVLPQMIKNGGGKVVTVLSSCVYGVPPKYLTSYIMAKYALLGMMKSLANEYAPKKVQFNAVSPSMISTKFCEGINKHVIEQSAMQNPMKRNAVVSDIIPVLNMLFDEKNTFITGANIPITGGEIY